MAGLAEDDLDPRARRRQRLIWAAGGLLALAAVASLGWGLKGWLGQGTVPARQVARIAVLPDTPPPPPPPPPKEQPKPEVKPQADDRPPPPSPTPPPPQAAPADAPIKMEGPAGEGPSAFGAGPVTEEYRGGTPSTGASAAGGGAPANDTLADRTQARFYAQSSRQTLQGELERLLRTEAEELQAGFLVWVDRQGAISRVQLQPTGDAAHDADLRAALDEARRSVRLSPPPARLPQPMNFRLLLRPQG
jgi:hypothetical protein